MVIKQGKHQWLTCFLIKSLVEVVLMNPIINLQMNFINKLFENFKKENFIHRDNIWSFDLADMQSTEQI